MNHSEPNKAILVDDNLIFRDCLKDHLNRSGSIEIISSIHSLDEFMKSCESFNFNLVYFNYEIETKFLTTATGFLLENYPDKPFILFNTSELDSKVFDCVSNGLMGIAWKDNSIHDLIHISNKVMEGERYYGGRESELIFKALAHAQNKRQKLESIAELTDREIDVIQLFTKGYSYKQIGETLNISPRTVESHKKNILSKLNLNSLIELVAYSIKNNIIDS